eukprot:3386795-Amphidinium_carterae.1
MDMGCRFGALTAASSAAEAGPVEAVIEARTLGRCLQVHLSKHVPVSTASRTLWKRSNSCGRC